MKDNIYLNCVYEHFENYKCKKCNSNLQSKGYFNFLSCNCNYIIIDDSLDSFEITINKTETFDFCLGTNFSNEFLTKENLKFDLFLSYNIFYPNRIKGFISLDEIINYIEKYLNNKIFE